MRKWKIELEVENQHMAIHMLVELVQQFTKAEMQDKIIGHMLMKTEHGSMLIEGDSPGDITFLVPNFHGRKNLQKRKDPDEIRIPGTLMMMKKK